MGNPNVVKVVLLGQGQVGKTCLVERYFNNRYQSGSSATIGAAFSTKELRVRGVEVTLAIWDTAGQERFQSLSKLYLRDAKAAIVCYDLTDKSSFHKALFWISELNRETRNCRIYLCGTKYDLIQESSDRREVYEEETKTLSENVRGTVYETSSKTGKDVHKMFTTIAVDHATFKMTGADPSTVTETVDLERPSPKSQRGPCVSCKT